MLSGSGHPGAAFAIWTCGYFARPRNPLYAICDRTFIDAARRHLAGVDARSTRAGPDSGRALEAGASRHAVASHSAWLAARRSCLEFEPSSPPTAHADRPRSPGRSDTPVAHFSAGTHRISGCDHQQYAGTFAIDAKNEARAALGSKKCSRRNLLAANGFRLCAAGHLGFSPFSCTDDALTAHYYLMERHIACRASRSIELLWE